MKISFFIPVVVTIPVCDDKENATHLNECDSSSEHEIQ